MALPRVFISSTYYDLKYVRNDIENFLKQMGCEPVLHERGAVTYSQVVELEESCYEEIEKCDILVCIIGGKYGTESKEGNYSITMQELNKAIKSKKKIYVYIQNDVYTENKTYMINKDNSFNPAFVDNLRVHEFICEIKDGIKNCPIISFNSVNDITNDLRFQIAGLFQKLLSQEASLTDSKTYYDLQTSSDIIRKTVEAFKKEKEDLWKIMGSIGWHYNYVVTKIRRQLGKKIMEFLFMI